MEKINEAADGPPVYGTYLLTQPTLAQKVAWAVYGLNHDGGMADDLMWPLRKQPLPPPESPRDRSNDVPGVVVLRAFQADGSEVPSRVRPLPDWAADLPRYTDADVPPAARRLLACVLRELVRMLPEEACKRIWDLQVDPLNLDPGDAEQMAGYAYLPAAMPDVVR